jgi:hypothetical protein
MGEGLARVIPEAINDVNGVNNDLTGLESLLDE